MKCIVLVVAEALYKSQLFLFSAPLFGADQAEDKKFKAPNNITGPLLILSHIVQQAYFPRSARDTLSFFLSKSVVVMQSHILLLWVWTTAACLGCIPYNCLLLCVCCGSCEDP